MLYLVYFPVNLKYQRVLSLAPAPPDAYGSLGDSSETDAAIESVTGQARTDMDAKLDKVQLATTPEWRLAVTLGFTVVLHLYAFSCLSNTV